MIDTTPEAFPHPVDYLPGMTYRQWLVGQVAAGIALDNSGDVRQDIARRVHKIVDAIIAEGAKR